MDQWRSFPDRLCVSVRVQDPNPKSWFRPLVLSRCLGRGRISGGHWRLKTSTFMMSTSYLQGESSTGGRQDGRSEREVRPTGRLGSRLHGSPKALQTVMKSDRGGRGTQRRRVGTSESWEGRPPSGGPATTSRPKGDPKVSVGVCRVSWVVHTVPTAREVDVDKGLKSGNPGYESWSHEDLSLVNRVAGRVSFVNYLRMLYLH